jgi:hypothetical protein
MLGIRQQQWWIGMPLRNKVTLAVLAPFFLVFVAALTMPILVLVAILHSFAAIYGLIRLLVHLVIFRKLPPRIPFPLDELDPPQNGYPSAP